MLYPRTASVRFDRLTAMLVVTLLVLAAGGCKSDNGTTALSDSAIANATYAVEPAPGGTAKLVDGVFTAPSPTGGATGGVTVRLADPRASGDLNGDKAPDAAVVLTAQTGGSGTFYNLHAVLNEGGAANPLAPVFLGDRVMLKEIVIKDGRITVDMVVAGPSDPACCPATPSTHVYTLENGALKLASKTP